MKNSFEPSDEMPSQLSLLIRAHSFSAERDIHTRDLTQYLQSVSANSLSQVKTNA